MTADNIMKPTLKLIIYMKYIKGAWEFSSFFSYKSIYRTVFLEVILQIHHSCDLTSYGIFRFYTKVLFTNETVVDKISNQRN